MSKNSLEPTERKVHGGPIINGPNFENVDFGYVLVSIFGMDDDGFEYAMWDCQLDWLDSECALTALLTAWRHQGSDRLPMLADVQRAALGYEREQRIRGCDMCNDGWIQYRQVVSDTPGGVSEALCGKCYPVACSRQMVIQSGKYKWCGELKNGLWRNKGFLMDVENVDYGVDIEELATVNRDADEQEPGVDESVVPDVSFAFRHEPEGDV